MNVGRAVVRHEVILLLAVLALVAVVGSINPAFFSLFNMFSLLKNMTVVGLLAIGFFFGLIVGGIDVSFAAVGVFAMYVTVKLANAVFPDAPIVLLFIASGGIGATLGLINGLLITGLRAPSLIVTLGTLSLYRGFLLYFVGTESIRQLPASVAEFARTNVLVLTAANGARVGLHVSVVLFAAIALVVFLVLRYTVVGRTLYAVGGSPTAASRMGMNVVRSEILAYTAVGFFAGIAGILSATVIRMANPLSLTGWELQVIAAVVLGGAAITGGRGSIVGVLLGVLLIALVNNSLILLGIPSAWQQVAIGALLIIAIGLPLVLRRMSGEPS